MFGQCGSSAVGVFGCIDSMEGNVLGAEIHEQSCEVFGVGCRG
jgi:hypothetical protein